MTTEKPTIVLVFEEEKDSVGLLSVVSSSDVSVCAHFASDKSVSDLAVSVDVRRVNNLRGKREELVDKVCEMLKEKAQTGFKDVVIPVTELQFLMEEVKLEKQEQEAEVFFDGDFDEELGEVKKAKAPTSTENSPGEVTPAELFEDEFTVFTVPIGKREEAA